MGAISNTTYTRRAGIHGCYQGPTSIPEQKVYVVDDDIVIRILLEEVFNAANLPVETYASAEEFLLAYDPNLRGCLVLDNLMPGMNGIELQEVLAAHGNKAPVIFLTGAGDVSIAVQGAQRAARWISWKNR